jgi:hypothetical protein
MSAFFDLMNPCGQRIKSNAMGAPTLKRHQCAKVEV